MNVHCLFEIYMLCGDAMLLLAVLLCRYVMLWVDRPLPLWIVQAFLAVLTFSMALLKIYIAKVRTLSHTQLLVKY